VFRWREKLRSRLPKLVCLLTSHPENTRAGRDRNCRGLCCQTHGLSSGLQGSCRGERAIRGCLQVSRAHPFLNPFSSQLLQTERHFWKDESLFPEPAAPAAITSCGLRAALASSRVPGMGPVCVSPRPGRRACLPHHLAIVLNLGGRRSSPCPGRGQITFPFFGLCFKILFLNTKCWACSVSDKAAVPGLR